MIVMVDLNDGGYNFLCFFFWERSYTVNPQAVFELDVIPEVGIQAISYNFFFCAGLVKREAFLDTLKDVGLRSFATNSTLYKPKHHTKWGTHTQRYMSI